MFRYQGIPLDKALSSIYNELVLFIKKNYNNRGVENPFLNEL